MKNKISYSLTGVDYNVMDPLKRLAQTKGQETAGIIPPSEFTLAEVQ